MDVTSYPAGIVLACREQTQMVVSVTCRVGSQQFHSWIASLLLVSLLFIAVPNPF